MKHECAVCMRSVDPDAEMGDADSGGYVPVQFPNEPPLEVWLHHRCLVNDGRDGAPIDGRIMLDHAEVHPTARPTDD